MPVVFMVIGTLVVSGLAAFVFYCALVVSSRADEGDARGNHRPALPGD